MRIKVITTEMTQGVAKNGKPYDIVNVNFKDVNTGRVSGKKLLPFGNHDTYDFFKVGDHNNKVYDVTAVKNGEFWDWVAPTPASDDMGSVQPANSTEQSTVRSGKGSWETTEERQLRQLYIIRQSSISNAIEFLKPNKVSSTEDVLATADKFVNYVMKERSDEQPV